MTKVVRSVGIDAGVPWEGYGADELAGRVALLVRALDRGGGPVYEVAGLLDAFHAAQLRALVDAGVVRTRDGRRRTAAVPARPPGACGGGAGARTGGCFIRFVDGTELPVAFARPQDAFVYVLLGGCDPTGAALVERSAGRERVLVAADRLGAAAASWRRGADGWRRRGGGAALGRGG